VIDNAPSPRLDVTDIQRALLRDPDAVAMVERLARRLARAWRNRLTYEELHQIGHLALAEEVLKYDRDRGTPFAAFALPGVRGAMLNALRVELRYQAWTRGFYKFASAWVDEGNPARDTEEDQRRGLNETYDAGNAAGALEIIGDATRRGLLGGDAAMAKDDALARLAVAIDHAKSELSPQQGELLRLHYEADEDLIDLAPKVGMRNYAEVRRQHRKALIRIGALLRAAGFTLETVREVFELGRRRKKG
jgi:hypothetical protein